MSLARSEPWFSGTHCKHVSSWGRSCPNRNWNPQPLDPEFSVFTTRLRPLNFLSCLKTICIDSLFFFWFLLLLFAFRPKIHFNCRALLVSKREAFSNERDQTCIYCHWSVFQPNDAVKVGVVVSVLPRPESNLFRLILPSTMMSRSCQ